MNQSSAILFLIIGFALVLILAFYAWHLWHEVAKRRAFRIAEQRQAEANCMENLALLADAMQNRQVELIEGSIRVAVFLDILNRNLMAQERFAIFRLIQQKTAQLHTHDARNNLNKTERQKEDAILASLRELYEKELLAASNELASYCRNWQH